MSIQKQITAQRTRRAYRVRNAVRSAGRLRLSVYRSNHHIYAQIIDDAAGKTLVAAGTTEKEFRSKSKFGSDSEAAAAVGKLLAERAKKAGISEVAFDRGHFRYHGRIAALADAAREGGLSF